MRTCVHNHLKYLLGQWTETAMRLFSDSEPCDAGLGTGSHTRRNVIDGRPRPAVMSMTVCTDGLQPSSQVELWHHAMAEAFVPLTLTRLDADRFSGTLHTDQIGELMVATLSASSQQVSRTSRLIAQGDRDLLQIAVGRRGNVGFEQDGRQAKLSPGDVVVYETARPFHITCDGTWEACVFTLPRTAVALSPAESRLITARPLAGQSGLTAVISRFLLDLADNTGELSLSQSRRVVTDMTDLVLALVVDSLEPTAGARSGTRRALLLQVKDYVERNLRDPGLTPLSIAAAHHISTRYLHTLFDAEPMSVAAYIRAHRLQRCARDLLDPRQARQSIGTIATRAGFGDPRAFERAFKTAYGMTAGEYRALRTATAPSRPPAEGTYRAHRA
jgi:AraC-like DNA-binding protein